MALESREGTRASRHVEEAAAEAGFLPGESQGQGSLVGCRLWGRTARYLCNILHNIKCSKLAGTVGTVYPWDYPGKNTGVGCHFPARGEGERVMALESREGTRASRHVEEGLSRSFSGCVGGVSGPSSSCVWNPRVFADDARGWQCPFVLRHNPRKTSIVPLQRVSRP